MARTPRKSSAIMSNVEGMSVQELRMCMDDARTMRASRDGSFSLVSPVGNGDFSVQTLCFSVAVSQHLRRQRKRAAGSTEAPLRRSKRLNG